MTAIRKGQYRGKLSREEFKAHFRRSYMDLSFAQECDAIDHLEAIAWDGHVKSRAAPLTRKAGSVPTPRLGWRLSTFALAAKTKPSHV
jgi:hypothetical protein